MRLLDRLVGAVAPLLTGSARLQPKPPYSPYPEPAANEFYNGLFCDVTADPALPADEAALTAIASDEAAEGRMRYRAYARLRALKRDVPPKILLGVIVELPHESGLDVLAGYSDGVVRFIRGPDRGDLVQGAEPLTHRVRKLFAAALPAVTHIGPWARDRTRLPGPPAGNVRLSFLVSEGWYFGEGGQASMEQGEMGGPIIRCARELLGMVPVHGQARTG